MSRKGVDDEALNGTFLPYRGEREGDDGQAGADFDVDCYIKGRKLRLLAIGRGKGEDLMLPLLLLLLLRRRQMRYRTRIKNYSSFWLWNYLFGKCVFGLVCSDHIDYLDDVERADLHLAFLLCFAWTTPWEVSEVWERRRTDGWLWVLVR